jgi:hypothetical protein
MPAILERLVKQLQAKGVANPYPIAVSQLQKHGILKSGSDHEMTPKGEKRNAMTPGERAADRAAKYSGGKHAKSDYSYNARTNMATLKRRR